MIYPPKPESQANGDNTCDYFGRLLKYTDAQLDKYAEEAVRLNLAATSHIAPDAAPRGKRDILAICDAYESGMGHGLERDGHKSGAIFGNPECGEAYELGYEEGYERSTGKPAFAPTDLSAVEVPPLPKPGDPQSRPAYSFSSEQMNNFYREGYAAGRASMKGNK